MRSEQAMVREFHQKIGQKVNDRPTLIDKEIVHLRCDYMDEEVTEYMLAAQRKDLVQIADALADLLYFVLGTCVAHGIDIEPVFAEVHRSNMTKMPDSYSHKGCVKGDDYEQPMLDGIISDQLHGIKEA